MIAVDEEYVVKVGTWKRNLSLSLTRARAADFASCDLEKKKMDSSLLLLREKFDESPRHLSGPCLKQLNDES